VKLKRRSRQRPQSRSDWFPLRAGARPRRALRARKTARFGDAGKRAASEDAPPPSVRWTVATDPGQGEDPGPPLGVGSLMVPPQLGKAARAEHEATNAVPHRDSEPAQQHTPADIASQIRSLESRLDRMIRRAQDTAERDIPPSIRDQVGDAARDVVERLAAPLPSLERPGSDTGTVVDAARELLSSDYYLRQWGRIGMRNRSEEVDEFGFDPTYERRFAPVADFLYQRYFRVETKGIDAIPNEGRCLIVANHSGTIPLDGVMLRQALRHAHPGSRPLRWLAEDYLYYLPFAGSFITRIGAVRACQENAERLLEQENVVAAFPEGVKGIGKLFKERYRLQRFGRGGFIRLCLRTQTPIVPCAIVGAEETGPLLHRVEYLAKLLGLPYIPITPTFPLFGPLGLIPAPTKWRIECAERIDLTSYGRGAAEDNVLVGRLTERVRAIIQHMLDEAIRSRNSVWLG
jgi:1-acyl-sn-glycerol-3-phosphate acyltransferase